MRRLLLLPTLLLALPTVVPACADNGTGDDTVAPADYQDLGLGDVTDFKDDGNWGAATTCKAIPVLTPLKDPAIVVSLDGLTLHLWDRQGSYDKVFAIGPGAIENGKSLTPVSTTRADQTFWTHTDEPQAVDGPTAAQQVWAYNYRCKMWWKDEDTGKYSPVFAGLPFIRLDGPPTAAYGIHGPIDSYTIPSGGNLRHGFVSHGCVRVGAADLVEIYALIQGHKTPVRIQKAIERRDNGGAVDLAQKWVGSECAVDADCNYDGGFCHLNAYSGRGFCSAHCDKFCGDQVGDPTGTFCVADPAKPTSGMCVKKSALVDNLCRRYDGMVTKKGVGRFSATATKADVCLPGSEGWIGDRCTTSTECPGGTCMPVDDGSGSVCTQACTKSCPDKTNYAGTFCVKASAESGLSDGMCVATCTRDDDCELGSTCESEPRNQQASVTKSVCLPY